MRFLKVLKEPQIIDLKFVEKKKDVLTKVCKNNHIVLLYLYGSLAQNKMRKLSDVDIAVLKSSGKLGLDDYFHILGELQVIFKREDIGLVDLREASPLLRMRILQFGRLIYFSDSRVVSQFRYKTITNYLATSFLRKKFFSIFTESIGSDLIAAR